MEDYSVLFTYFERLKAGALTSDEKTELRHIFTKSAVKKRTILVQAGVLNSKHYYVEKGLLRLYVIDQNGKEFNILFARERQWIGDLNTPAETPYFIETVEDSRVFAVSEKHFRLLYKRYGSITNYIRRSYVFLQKRFVSVLSKTAEENYDTLVREYPELIQRLPQYHISSYLGVTPEFLSKIIARRTKRDE